MALRGSITIKDKRYKVDNDFDNRNIDVYPVKEDAQARAKALREQGWSVRVRWTTCTEGSEEVWQVFKRAK